MFCADCTFTPSLLYDGWMYYNNYYSDAPHHIRELEYTIYSPQISSNNMFCADCTFTPSLLYDGWMYYNNYYSDAAFPSYNIMI
jgi:hypothetical protein